MKTLVLAILPDESMRNIMDEAAARDDQIELLIQVGDLDKGAKIAGSIGENYDVIMSSGATADLIRRECATPVIDLGVSTDQAIEPGPDRHLISTDTIENAFRYAIELTKASGQYKERACLLESMLSFSEQIIFVFTQDGGLTYSCGDVPARLAILDKIQHDKGLWQLPENEPQLELFGDSFWLIFRKNIETQTAIYTAFSLRKFPAYPVGAQRGITITENYEPEHNASENYMEQSRYMHPVLELARRYSKLNFPVVLIGERGVGKDTLAYIMKNYSKSKFAATIMIDCILIDEPSWISLLNDINSILFQSNVIFYYRNFELLFPALKDKLVKHISRMKTQDKSFHIIAINSDSTLSEGNCLMPSILDTLQCNTLFIPSLRARKGDIPILVTQYIDQMNACLNRQTARIEVKGINLLKNYIWPGNLYQFKRVLSELFSMTDAPVITELNVRSVLQNENNNMVISNTNTIVNMVGTLADIEKRIIHHVLQEEDKNHTRTANRLGISRVTLWRKLNGDS